MLCHDAFLVLVYVCVSLTLGSLNVQFALLQNSCAITSCVWPQLLLQRHFKGWKKILETKSFIIYLCLGLGNTNAAWVLSSEVLYSELCSTPRGQDSDWRYARLDFHTYPHLQILILAQTLKSLSCAPPITVAYTRIPQMENRFWLRSCLPTFPASLPGSNLFTCG